MNWLRYSGIWVTLVGNPYHWRIGLVKESNVWDEPNRKEFAGQLAFLTIRIVLDNGKW
jgi:hypothetical protein